MKYFGTIRDAWWWVTANAEGPASVLVGMGRPDLGLPGQCRYTWHGKERYDYAASFNLSDGPLERGA